MGTELKSLLCLDRCLASMIKESERMVDVIHFELLSATSIRTGGGIRNISDVRARCWKRLNAGPCEHQAQMQPRQLNVCFNY